MASDNGSHATGALIAKQVINPTAFREIGRTGLSTYSGQVREEFLPALQGIRARRTYREMSENDPIVGAMLLAVDLLMREVNWHVEPAEAGPEPERWATHVDTCLHDMSMTWEATLSSALSMLPFGWSAHEIVYKMRRGEQPESDDPNAPASSRYDDGLVGWRKLPIRVQESLIRWQFDDSGGIQGMEQATTGYGNVVPIPIGKLLLFRTTGAKNNPEGRSVLRNAYRPWFFKRRIEEIEAIGIERDLAGLPVAWVPPNLLSATPTPDESELLAAIRAIIRDIKRDDQEGVVWPLAFDEHGNKEFDLTLLTTGGRRQFDTDSIIARYNQNIAMTILADFLLLGHEKVGSFALGASKVDLFSIALGAWLDEIASVLNDYGIPRLMRMNGVPAALWPHLTHDEVKEVDLQKLGVYVLAISQSGLLTPGDQETENHLRTLAGLPTISEPATGGGL